MTDERHELHDLLAAPARGPSADGSTERARRQALLALVAAGAVADPTDQVDAARILLAGEDLAEVAAAERLALAAMARAAAARPLAAAAFDRQRLLRGEPQKFGTQTVVREGRVELWPVAATTTDSERAKWGVPPLAELRARCEGGA